ncbi:MAG: hypothetical protein IH866_03055 [Chloroflexi bacterium]|nr:hypothetical protein [Chloroflexota bacterium]
MDDLTNRILTVGVALLSIFLIFLVILLAWGAPVESIDWAFDLAKYLEDHNNTEAKLIITFGGVILMLLATLLIIFEVLPPETNALSVTKASSGAVQISTEEVVRRLEEELQLLPQISQAQATILGRGKKAEVHLNLHVTADADLAATADEANQRARALMEDRMGLELARPPQTEIRYRELHVGRRVEAAPGAITAAPEPPPVTAAPPEEPSPPTATNPPAAESPPDPATNPDPEAGRPPPAIESMRDETTETAEEDRPAGA